MGGQRLVRGTDMAWGNVVLSENQNDVGPCATQRGYEAEIPTCATAESTSSAAVVEPTNERNPATDHSSPAVQRDRTFTLNNAANRQVT
jgi:hypothetical protein